MTDKTHANCPVCNFEIYFDSSAKEVVCDNCKSEFTVDNHRSFVQEFYSLFVNIKEWFLTNWRKIITKIDDVIVSESLIYESRCWSCKEPIRAVKTRSKLKKWVANKWLGNQKCPKPDCNYFLCSHCGMCLCDGPYSYKKTQKPFLRKWVKTDGAG